MKTGYNPVILNILGNRNNYKKNYNILQYVNTSDNDQQKYLRSNKELIVDFPIVSAFDKK